MIKKKRSLLGRTHPSVIAVWAAVLAAGYVLPSVPMIGTGATFSISSVLAPLTGIFFGPLTGLATGAIGGLIGSLLAPHTAWLGMATLILPATAAFAAGLVTEGKWSLSAIPLLIIAVFTALWFTHPIGRAIPIYPITYYGGGVIAIIVGTILSAKKFLLGSQARKAIAIFVICYAGLITVASVGNYFALILFEIPVEAWYVLTVQSPVQRIIFSIGATIIGLPLITGLPKMGVYVGPERKQVEQEEEELE